MALWLPGRVRCVWHLQCTRRAPHRIRFSDHNSPLKFPLITYGMMPSGHTRSALEVAALLWRRRLGLPSAGTQGDTRHDGFGISTSAPADLRSGGLFYLSLFGWCRRRAVWTCGGHLHRGQYLPKRQLRGNTRMKQTWRWKWTRNPSRWQVYLRICERVFIHTSASVKRQTFLLI